MKYTIAKCACGHVGRSARPEFYQCGFCYYANRADANEQRAKTLRARACKLLAEARKFRQNAASFRRRNPR